MPIEIHSHFVAPSGATAPGGIFPWVRKPATPKAAGNIISVGPITLTLTASRLYFVPFSVPREVSLTGLRLYVSTSAAGSASLGIYENAVVSGNDQPGALLASVTGLDTGTTGDKSGTFGAALALAPGAIYWACLICSAAPMVRALSSSSMHSGLGRQTGGGTQPISYLYAAGSGSTLPATAPASPSDGTVNVPAIYLLE